MNRSRALRTILPSLFLMATVAGAAGQEVVSLYLKDDPTSYQVTTLPADDPRLANASAVPYASDQDTVWKWLELNQTFIGHVRKSYVTKGLTVQVGAPIYFVPGDEDAFLTILEDGGDAEVLEAVGDWVRISVNATIPVYFESDTPATPISDEPVVLNETIQQPETETSYEVGSAVVQDDPVTYEPVDLAPASPYPGESIDRILEGKLMPYKPFFKNPWNKPAYQWEILNRKKKRIAFVDTSNLILDRPLESFQGLQVSLAGSIYQINKGRDLVIVANQLSPQ